MPELIIKRTILLVLSFSIKSNTFCVSVSTKTPPPNPFRTSSAATVGSQVTSIICSNTSLPYTILQKFREIWDIAYTERPWSLGLQFINALRRSEIPKLPGKNLKHVDIIHDPLILFKVDRRIFRVPLLALIFLMVTIYLSSQLQIVGSYMIASRKHLSTQALLAVLMFHWKLTLAKT